MVVVVVAIPSSIDDMEDSEGYPNSSKREQSRPASSALLGPRPGAGHLAGLRSENSGCAGAGVGLLLVSCQGMLKSVTTATTASPYSPTFLLLDVNTALALYYLGYQRSDRMIGPLTDPSDYILQII